MKAGDTVHVTLRVDRAPKVVAVPAELERALAASPEAGVRWVRMAQSHRNEYAEFVGEAKRPETRERRAAQTVERLLEISPTAGRGAG